jgi:hypothetical protein
VCVPCVGVKEGANEGKKEGERAEREGRERPAGERLRVASLSRADNRGSMGESKDASERVGRAAGRSAAVLLWGTEWVTVRDACTH